MQTSTSVSEGCGSGSCGCASTPTAETTYPVPTINGIALFEQGQNPPAEAVHELAYAELLRQEAVKAGLLPRHKGLVAPELTDAERARGIQQMMGAGLSVTKVAKKLLGR